MNQAFDAAAGKSNLSGNDLRICERIQFVKELIETIFLLILDN